MGTCRWAWVNYLWTLDQKATSGKTPVRKLCMFLSIIFDDIGSTTWLGTAIGPGCLQSIEKKKEASQKTLPQISATKTQLNRRAYQR